MYFKKYMKFHRPLEEILGSRSKIAILRFLSTQPQPITGRQIALGLKMSVWACHQSLQELAGMGVLLMKNLGSRYTFELLPDTYVAQELLLPLFRREAASLDTFLEKTLRPIKKYCLSIILYGSVARGDETAFSDVDLCMITETQREKHQVKAILKDNWYELIGEFGNSPSPYVLTRRELLEREERGLPLLKNIQAEGRLLHGQPIKEFLRDAA